MYKGVIFDLDGTLINSIEDIGNSLNRILKKHGLPERSIQDYSDNIGQGLLQLTKDSAPSDISQEMLDTIFPEFIADYGENYNVKTKAYDGIMEMLKTLRDKDILLGVNSNKKHEYTVELMNTLFPEIPFVLVLGDRENVNKKPDPTSANEIVEAMNLDKKDVVYVGDTNHDINTAQNAELNSIGVTWGYRSKQVLVDEGASHIAETANEIVDIVLK